MTVPRVLFAIGGAAIAAVIGSLDKRGSVHAGAVRATAFGMRAQDRVSRVISSIADEASDINAEARRQARIDAAVAERLAELEEGVRAEVIARLDASGQA